MCFCSDACPAMARVFIVGAGPLQVPLIHAAGARGHWVLVADIDPGAPGVALADQFVRVSTVDEEGVAQAAQRYGVDAVVTGATDQPLRAVARATALCGLRGMSEETALLVTRKDLMRQALSSHSVPCPAFVVVENREDCERARRQIPGPLVLKPVDSSGSRGVSFVGSGERLFPALDHALTFSRAARAIAEEYVEGPEFSVETLSIDGELHVVQITEKLTTGPPHFVEAGHVQPAKVSASDRIALEDVTKAVVTALDVTSGPTHTELKLAADGPVVIEVGARLGGDYITSDLVPLSTGIDMVGLTVDIALGEGVSIPSRADRAACIRYFFPDPGRIVGVEGLPECRADPAVVRVEVFKRPGDRVAAVTGSHERAGYVLTAGVDPVGVRNAADECLKRVRFVMEQS